MQLPPLPGVYVVEMLNEKPISVNADRSHIADRCISVTRVNCKYGKAKNLRRRQRDYEKTFGTENVRFRYCAVTPHYADVETMVGARLLHYRIPGTTGRLTEWLQGISPESVEALVREILEFVPTDNSTPLQTTAPQIVRPQQIREPVGVTPAAIVTAAKYLERSGMTLELLRKMHHSPRRGETFKSTLRYFAGKLELKENNVKYGARLTYVAQQHKETGNSLTLLVSEAMQRFPSDA